MSERLIDQEARDRFRDEWDRNFAVSANAGSGKTTAISERLAALALAPQGAELLRKTAVVTFTRKAAAQIGQRARAVLMRRLVESGRTDLAPLDHLERAFFGTIHSFCLLLAQRYGQALGINLNPVVVAENDDALWEEFLEQDAMQFTALSAAQVGGFLRHAPLESVFPLARRLDFHTAGRLVARDVADEPPGPAALALQEILAAATKAGKSLEALKRNQETARQWGRRFTEENSYLPFPKPEGTAANIKGRYAELFAPVKHWLAGAGAVLAAELALRYRAWRFERGVQTYSDQIDAALAVMQDEAILEKIRAENWRVVLDEAQDTDPSQFSVLVEVTRPPGAALGTWPDGGGAGPRAGHFCMVGDGQQAIYGDRADIRNFSRHVDAFARGDGGELLSFEVTFRAPHRVIELLNATLPETFGHGREHNSGLPPAEHAPAPLLQVRYSPLAPGHANLAGATGLVPMTGAAPGRQKVDVRLAAEVRELAAWLRAGGPAAVGARTWGEICVLAPRNDWLLTARKELEAAGLKTALQVRRNRNGDNPVYAWITGLLAALADPENLFEWTGVLREIFGLSDALIASTLRTGHKFHWDEPERHPEPLQTALRTLKPLVERVDAEAGPLARFARDLADACNLAGRARALDPGGALSAELERLLAEAAELGLEGAGPRTWLRELLAGRDNARPSGKPDDDAINLLTSHSAKGLEWPVVIPIGLWRKIGKAPEDGMRLVPGPGDESQVFFDHESLPAATREARERERLRELVRLLYVTMTRPRRTLALPWGVGAGASQEGSFAHLWGMRLDDLPALVVPAGDLPPIPGKSRASGVIVSAAPVPLAKRTWPARLLPHQLARKPDLARMARHEAALDEPPMDSREDPIEYGLWWHETMEFLPWQEPETEVRKYCDAALERAEAKGFARRGRKEMNLLQASGSWRELHAPRWRILSELSVLAPLPENGWVDGIIDFVAHDPAAGQLLVLDWKTNRIREGEGAEALLDRLTGEYRPQLAAYGACLAQFFPKEKITLAVYATAVGCWREI